MRFVPTELPHVFAIELEFHRDPRGFLAEIFVADRFERTGRPFQAGRSILSRSSLSGTVRGMHYQAEPKPQAKLVYCVRGRVHDVVVDVRPGSPTFGRHVAFELTEDNGRGIFVPEMCAHGWQALTDGAEILYLVQGDYSPTHERGLRFDDPAVGIAWPVPVRTVSEKDQRWPALAQGGCSP